MVVQDQNIVKGVLNKGIVLEKSNDAWGSIHDQALFLDQNKYVVRGILSGDNIR